MSRPHKKTFPRKEKISRVIDEEMKRKGKKGRKILKEY